MYNYSPILHDLWADISVAHKRMVSVYGDKQDLPEDFRNLFEKDLPVMIAYIKQWQVNNLHNCDCGNGSKKIDKKHCPKCFLGKTGWRLKEYVATNMGDN